MQAMFHSVGLGAGALPVAAVVNWVLKDGIGQLGGVLFARYEWQSCFFGNGYGFF